MQQIQQLFSQESIELTKDHLQTIGDLCRSEENRNALGDIKILRSIASSLCNSSPLNEIQRLTLSARCIANFCFEHLDNRLIFLELSKESKFDVFQKLCNLISPQYWKEQEVELMIPLLRSSCGALANTIPECEEIQKKLCQQELDFVKSCNLLLSFPESSVQAMTSRALCNISVNNGVHEQLFSHNLLSTYSNLIDSEFQSTDENSLLSDALEFASLLICPENLDQPQLNEFIFGLYINIQKFWFKEINKEKEEEEEEEEEKASDDANKEEEEDIILVILDFFISMLANQEENEQKEGNLLMQLVMLPIVKILDQELQIFDNDTTDTNKNADLNFFETTFLGRFSKAVSNDLVSKQSLFWLLFSSFKEVKQRIMSNSSITIDQQTFESRQLKLLQLLTTFSTLDIEAISHINEPKDPPKTSKDNITFKIESLCIEVAVVAFPKIDDISTKQANSAKTEISISKNERQYIISSLAIIGTLLRSEVTCKFLLDTCTISFKQFLPSSFQLALLMTTVINTDNDRFNLSTFNFYIRKDIQIVQLILGLIRNFLFFPLSRQFMLENGLIDFLDSVLNGLSVSVERVKPNPLESDVQRIESNCDNLLQFASVGVISALISNNTRKNDTKQLEELKTPISQTNILKNLLLISNRKDSFSIDEDSKLSQETAKNEENSENSKPPDLRVQYEASRILLRFLPTAEYFDCLVSNCNEQSSKIFVPILNLLTSDFPILHTEATAALDSLIDSDFASSLFSDENNTSTVQEIIKILQERSNHALVEKLKAKRFKRINN